MKIEVIVFQDEQPQEDGTVLRPWVAASATHAVSAQGATPRKAMAEFARWLRLACDDDEANVPPLDFVRTPKPFKLESPIEPNGPAHAAVLHEWLARWRKAGKLGDYEAFVGDDGLVHPPSFPIYDVVSTRVRAMFDTGIPYREVEVPGEWDVRIVAEG